jgi:hypothetical protein
VTKRTKYRGYRYPVQSERAAGALDIERLARDVDRDFDLMRDQWAIINARRTISYAPSGTITGIFNGSDWSVSYPTVEFQVGDASLDDVPAYWLVTCYAAVVPSGTVNVNTRRTLKVKVLQDSPTGLVAAETYQCYESQAVAPNDSYLAVEFVTLLNPNRLLQVSIFHDNTGSTLNLTAGHLTQTRLMFA